MVDDSDFAGSKVISSGVRLLELGDFEVLLSADSFVAEFEIFFWDEFVGIIFEFEVW